MSAPIPPPMGWYIDPRDPRQQRYWDGAAWTEQVQQTEGSAPTNGFAIASLVLSLAFIGVGSVLAIIFGLVARKQIRERNQSGDGLATAGVIIGIISIAGLAILIVWAIAAGPRGHSVSHKLPPSSSLSALPLAGQAVA